ncbi:cytochrome P450 [Paraburkholderia hayleyella]|uniref:cytochrome P450 n=1 Tax=Paraburkholderia hayleyella TaxID=2152889 RepID=UPI0012927A0D|nr:cytochrome P450 [Paraburkholderia hayleyella]
MRNSSNTSEALRALRQVADLPCPPGLPLLGNLHQIITRKQHLTLERWAADLGTPYRLRICGKPIIVWTDAELCQAISRERPHRYRRFAPLETVLEEMGCNGLFSVEGVAWEPQRKLVMQALSIPNIKSFYPTLHDITQRLHARWQRAAARGTTVEMTEDFKRYTVDITSALAFGEDPRTLDAEGSVIQEPLALILPTVMSRTNTPFPYWRYLKLPRDRRVEQALTELHRYVRQLMQRARERMQNEPTEHPRHFLEAMLRLRDTPGSGLSDDQVAANVFTLLLAGEDTTANSLSWTLLYATQAPLQQRLADTARAALGTHTVCPDYAGLKALDLFEAVCTEASRFRPVAAVSTFEPLEDVCLQNVQIPAGTTMFFLSRPSMQDERHFAEPQTFDVERWLRERDAHSGAHDPRAYLQFGAGPRVCPGRHLANVQMRLALSMLFANFDVELMIDPAQIKETSAFTMMPDTVPVRLTERRRPTSSLNA